MMPEAQIEEANCKEEEVTEESRQHERNSEMVDRISSVLNKIVATMGSDKFATPLRIQRDLLHGPEIMPIESQQT